MAKKTLTTFVAVALALASARHAGAEEAGDRAEALILATAVNRFVAKQLPVTFQIRGERAAGILPSSVSLSEARYCGAVDLGHGRLIGVLRPSGESHAGPPLLTGPQDCQAKLDDVVRRLPPGVEGAAVVEILAEWVPWQLRFSLGNTAVSGPGSAALGAALARAKAAGPLEVVDTSAIHLATERGASLDLDLALWFAKSGDGIHATLTVAPASGRPREPRPAFLNQAGAPAVWDAVAGATFPFAQRVVTLFGQDGPLVLELEHQAVEVRGLQVSGGDGQLTVRGRATSRALQESLRLSIESGGVDLKIGEVRAAPELEDCGAASGVTSLGCRARNTARSAAAAAVASALTARYRGQLLRALLVPPPFAFDLGGRRLTLRLVPTRAQATAAGLLVFGRGELE